jgi:hypothetical protein
MVVSKTEFRPTKTFEQFHGYRATQKEMDFGPGMRSVRAEDVEIAVTGEQVRQNQEGQDERKSLYKEKCRNSDTVKIPPSSVSRLPGHINTRDRKFCTSATHEVGKKQHPNEREEGKKWEHVNERKARVRHR